jgi:hypothetical protein
MFCMTSTHQEVVEARKKVKQASRSKVAYYCLPCTLHAQCSAMCFTATHQEVVEARSSAQQQPQQEAERVAIDLATLFSLGP